MMADGTPQRTVPPNCRLGIGIAPAPELAKPARGAIA